MRQGNTARSGNKITRARGARGGRERRAEKRARAAGNERSERAEKRAFCTEKRETVAAGQIT